MATREELGIQLTSTSRELRDLYFELGEAEAVALEARYNAHLSSNESSVTGLRMDLEFSENEQRRAIVKLKGEIAALEEYRDHLKFIIAHNLEDVEAGL